MTGNQVWLLINTICDPLESCWLIRRESLPSLSQTLRALPAATLSRLGWEIAAELLYRMEQGEEPVPLDLAGLAALIAAALAVAQPSGQEQVAQQAALWDLREQLMRLRHGEEQRGEAGKAGLWVTLPAY